MTTLLEEIKAKCTPEQIASRDDGAIAAQISMGRKKRNAREIGNGTILEVLGLEVGNALLDVINTVPDFRHVKPLVDQGRLLVGSQLVQTTVQSLVPAVLTKEQADALCALGWDPDPVDPFAVRCAIWADNGDYLL